MNWILLKNLRENLTNCCPPFERIFYPQVALIDWRKRSKRFVLLLLYHRETGFDNFTSNITIRFLFQFLFFVFYRLRREIFLFFFIAWQISSSWNCCSRENSSIVVDRESWHRHFSGRISCLTWQNESFTYPNVNSKMFLSTLFASRSNKNG